jgi:hypothetical protein
MRFPFLLASLLLGACAPKETGPVAAVAASPDWRNVATSSDRDRLRDWRDAWVRGLAAARAGGHGAEIAAEGDLLEPDVALDGAAPPAGAYRCRTLKLGARTPGLRDFVSYPAFDCRIDAASADGAMGFTKLRGSQRPIGRLFPDRGRRMIFLGTLQLGDERGIHRYGHDRDRDMIALVERVGERRWRMVFPFPHFESVVDVIELVPAS